MITLLPRLPAPAAEQLLDKFLENGPDAWAGFDYTTFPQAVRFAATGGTQVSPRQLREFREGIIQIAETNGFGASGHRAGFAGFDAQAAAWLADHSLLTSGEGLRDDVWAFLGVALLPDVVYWRFGAARERYLGGIRNTFQRLWARGRALDRGPSSPDRWQLLDALTEDALVQITERPSLGGDPLLAHAIAEAWLRAAHQHGKGAMEAIMRSAVLRIRVWNEVRSLSDLPAADLALVLDEAFGIKTDKGRGPFEA